jgi:hypothetical protein
MCRLLLFRPISPASAHSFQAQTPTSRPSATDRIDLDGVALDGSTANGGQLLINGVAVATVNQNVSSITNWATYPALSSITYSGGGGSGGLINMSVGNISTLNSLTANLTNISSAVGTISTITANTGNFTRTTATTETVSAVTVSTINGKKPDFYDGTNVLAGNYTAANGTSQID